MSGVHFYLSVSDLLLVDGFAEAYGSGNKEKISSILKANGMNIDEGVEEVFCTHRNLRGDVVKCVRYEGFELTTDEWLRTGAASLESHIASCPDASKRIELKMLNPRASNAAWEED